MRRVVERFQDLIHREAEAVSWALKAGLSVLRFLYFVAYKSWKDSLVQRAAALSFFTVLDLFPILILVLFGLTRNPLFQSQLARAKQFLVGQFVTPASSQLVEELFTTLELHLDLLGSGAVGVAALAFLLLVGTTLLVLVEKSVNEIWRAPRHTGSFLARAAILWAVVTLLPILVAASLAVQSRLTAAIPGALPEPVGRLGLSFAISSFLLFFLFKWVPRTRVRLVPALVAALLTATLWEVAKQGLSLYVQEVLARSLFSKVYGSLYLVPIGLLWIYYSWVLFLFGAQCAYVLQEFRTLRSRERERWLLGQGFVPLSGRVAMAVLMRLADRFGQGRGPTPLAELVQEFRLHPEEALLWAQAIEGRGWAVHTGAGVLTLARPAGTILVGDVRALYEETFLKFLGEGSGPLGGVPLEGEARLKPEMSLLDLLREFPRNHAGGSCASPTSTP